MPADVDEDIIVSSPQELVKSLASQKAQRIADSYPQAIIIAADTIVVVDSEVLGKPTVEAQARSMLIKLSGRMHQVMTGLSVYCAARDYYQTIVEVTNVEFRSLTIGEIEAYIKTGEPFDKAGAYGIQERGALLVTGIEGCYFNVVGLPLNRLGQILRELGVNVLGR
jgi:septum formation protein